MIDLIGPRLEDLGRKLSIPHFLNFNLERQQRLLRLVADLGALVKEAEDARAA